MRKHSPGSLAGACAALIVLAGIMLAGASTSASAQQLPPDDPNTLSLSDAQKADLLSHDSESSVDAARAGLGAGGPDRKIHGELGVMVGTNGARAAYGTAAIPLGDNAGAVVSFESSHYGRPR